MHVRKIHKLKMGTVPVLVAVIIIVFASLLCSCMKSRGTFYQVQKGDTLYSISRVCKVDIDTLMNYNELGDTSELKADSTIYIPSEDCDFGQISYSENIDSRESYARNETTDKIKSYGEPKREESFKPLKKGDYIWPIDGNVLTRFGHTANHRYDGINIQGRWGEDIKAVYPGEVVYSGSGVEGYGNMVIIKHKNRLYTIYALNSENLVSRGDEVRQSQVIAKVGGLPKMGRSFLHFQVRKGKKAIDPLSLFR